MIVIDEITSRWIRELDRFLSVKNLLFLHGNILDVVSYPVRESSDDQVRWVPKNSLPQFLHRFLREAGYEVIGQFDPVDGLTFVEPEMESIFHRSISGDSAELSQQPTDTRSQTKPEASWPLHRTGRHKNKGDTEAALTAITQAMCNNRVASAFVFYMASRLLTSPSTLSERDLALFTRVLWASLKGEKILRHNNESLSNVIILVCDKLNDLPPFLYINNPRARSIHVDRPDISERERYFCSLFDGFHGIPRRSEPPQELVSQFGVLTDGMTYL